MEISGRSFINIGRCGWLIVGSINQFIIAPENTVAVASSNMGVRKLESSLCSL